MLLINASQEEEAFIFNFDLNHIENYKWQFVCKNLSKNKRESRDKN